MFKIATLIILSFALTGCGWFERKVTANVMGYSIVCVKETKVRYVQFPSGIAPLYTPDGRLVLCDSQL